MQYRKFGKTGLSVSALGFGAMRLPVLEDNRVDEARAIAMIRHAIDEGVNYVDTAYPYHQGESERIVGKALSDGYREKTYLATKCPVWKLEKAEDFEILLNEQLEKLQTDHVDFYLLHALSRERFEEKVKKFELVKQMEKARKDGKIRYLGFSFHDSYDVFQDILDYYDGWDFCQIQYNYVDLTHQAGAKGLKEAAAKGLAVVIMEPLLGGKLANPADHVKKIFPKDKSCVEYALDFLWDQPEVSLLLSGMSDEAQLEDNLQYADRSHVHMVTEEEKEIYKKAKEVYDSMALVGCTGCRYCIPCPFGLPIPDIFTLYNMTAAHKEEEAKERYRSISVNARECRACHHCEKECPQMIKISQVMPEVAKVFAKLEA
ncbi:aldo/keto reductase [Lacrimispora sp.]|uniref:aldo/keto reductase n=1 Tax=Lacrimispora sp. TaxID=2719234 RepID=UPI003995BD87